MKISADLQSQQAASIKIQGRHLARRHGDRAVICHHESAVKNGAAEQRHRAAVCRPDRAVIDDGAGCAVQGAKRKMPRGGIETGHLQRARDERADVELGTAAEQNAVRIEQYDPAVRIDLAKDLARICIQNFIDCHRAGRGLGKLYGVAGTDIEALPGQRQLVRELLDQRCRGAGMQNAAGTTRHGTTARTGRQGRWHARTEADGRSQAHCDRAQLPANEQSNGRITHLASPPPARIA